MRRVPRVYVPRDSAALSVGAEDVANAIAQRATATGVSLTLVRNGSRGMFWREPLVEVETPAGRVAYGPVTVADVPGLFEASFQHGGEHPLRLGLTEDLPFLRAQDRLTFRRVGVTDPVDLDDYAAHGGLRGLREALSLSPRAIVDAMIRSGLRGRGGAAFPAGIKWRTVAEAPLAPGQTKYIVCNADEGDSGTFSDRMLMEGDPFLLLEGMAIAARATGATKGFIYLRSEYPHAERVLHEALEIARRARLLGPSILGSDLAFDIELRRGAGAYICGEETAMLESLEGKRGMVRPKPPLPALEGLFGAPTVVNNVLTLATAPVILDKGPDYYASFGAGRSRGTLPFQLAGNVKQGGLVEKGFGLTLRQLIDDFGGGTATGRRLRAVQVGGPLGAYFPQSKLDTPLDYEPFAAAGGLLGHGGVVLFDDTVDMGKMARYAMEFCALESCGKCTPCRVGSVRGVEVIDALRAEREPTRRGSKLTLLRDLCDTLLHGSLCAMGGMTPYPVLSALDAFPEDFGSAAAPASAPEPPEAEGAPCTQ